MNYKKVLITGGAGFVGSNLAIKFKNKYPNIVVIAADNLRRRGSELSLARLNKAGVEFKHLDIRHTSDFEGLDCDLILECSAEPSCIAGIDSGLSYLINTNLLGTANCLDFAHKCKADVLFLSTSRVYPFDKINSLDFDESETRIELSLSQDLDGLSSQGISSDFSLEGVRTFYGATKLASELIINEYRHFKGLRAIINRCSIIAGPWQMGKIDQGVMVFWLASHIFRRPLKYIGWKGQGKQVRDFLHIDDLFSLIDIQVNDFNKYCEDTYTVGGGLDFSFSLLELSDICQKVTGKKVEITSDLTQRQGDVCWYVSDSKKIRALSGWEPKKNLETSAGEIADWINDNSLSLKNIL